MMERNPVGCAKITISPSTKGPATERVDHALPATEERPMPIQRLAANCGIFEPEDLSFLQSIFDESCAVHEHLGEEQSTEIARKLFVLFKGGTRDRELLKITISKAFGGAVPSHRHASALIATF